MTPEIRDIMSQIEALNAKLAEARRRSEPPREVSDYEFRTAEGETIRLSQLFGDKPNSFISTDFEKKTAYNRAIMGELARIIKRIDGVESASVLINVPEEQLFAELMKELGFGRRGARIVTALEQAISAARRRPLPRG